MTTGILGGGGFACKRRAALYCPVCLLRMPAMRGCALVLLFLLLLVGGCGQKGPLYLPDDAETTENE